MSPRSKQRAYRIVFAGLAAAGVALAILASRAADRTGRMRTDLAARDIDTVPVPDRSATLAGLREEERRLLETLAAEPEPDRVVAAAEREFAAVGGPARFALRLHEVRRDLLPLILRGVSQGRDGFVGVFEYLPRREALPAREGQPIGDSGFTVAEISVDRPQETGKGGIAVARIRFRDGNDLHTLVAGMPAETARPGGLFSAPGGAVRLRAGQSIERAGLSYEILGIQESPPLAEVRWRILDQPGSGGVRHLRPEEGTP